MDTQIIELNRPNKSAPWGFSIQGGREFGCPLSVLRVTSGSIADQFGITIGDLLVKINNLSTDPMTHQQAITQIQNLAIILEIRKSKVNADFPPPPPIADNLNNSCRIYNSTGDLPPPPPALVLSKPTSNILFPQPPPPLPFLNELHSSSVQKPLPFLKELQSTEERKPKEEKSASTTKFDHLENKSKATPLIIPDSKKFEEQIFVPKKKLDYFENNNTQTVNPNKTSVPLNKFDNLGYNKSSNVLPILDTKKVELFQQRMNEDKPKTQLSSASLGKFIQNQSNNPERDSKDLLIQQINLDKNSAICFVCKDHIKGAYVEAKNKIYCQNHFCCSFCGESIKGQFIESKDGKLYCMDDYRNNVAPKCNRCGSPVIESQIVALDKFWHAKCFVCELCKEPITNGRFHMVENDGIMSVCCERDYKEHYEIKCSECDFAIESDEKYLLVNGKNVHVKCFKR